MNPEIEQYKQAVWDFMLEHCDVMHDSGALFIKFHSSGRGDFEKRVRSRLKGYHREDVRTKETIHQNKQIAFKQEKKYKQDTWKASQQEKRKVMAELKRKNRIIRIVRAMRMGFWVR